MPDIRVTIGGREYEVSCQPGEEGFLRSAAGMLDAETLVLGPQAARLPESRLLLMAGLMLADKTAGMEDQMRSAEARLAEAEAELEELRQIVAAGRSEARLPEAALARLQSLAGRAEELASEVESRLA